jgi:Outer membrane protein beta-barrel domain
MKRIFYTLAAVLLMGTMFAQENNEKTDTVRVGNFVIIKKKSSDKDNSDDKKVYKRDNDGVSITIDRSNKRRRRNISTNWWIMDLGFANYRDNTNYAAANAGGYLRTLRTADGSVNSSTTSLNTGKSSNVNLWFFMQKLNVTKNVVNLKYGLGLEMYNFRYDTRLSYRKDNNGIAYAFVDSTSFSKNKLYVGYLTVPLMINFDATPDRKRGFSFSAGVSAGYLIGSRNKQISGNRGKDKISGNFDLEPFRLAAISEIGLGPVRIYGSYSLNNLHKSSTRMEQAPYTVGIRFSNW